MGRPIGRAGVGFIWNFVLAVFRRTLGSGYRMVGKLRKFWTAVDDFSQAGWGCFVYTPPHEARAAEMPRLCMPA